MVKQELEFLLAAEMAAKIALDNAEFAKSTEEKRPYVPARCSRLHRKKQRAHAQKKNKFPVSLRKEILREKKDELRYNKLTRDKLREQAIIATMYE